MIINLSWIIAEQIRMDKKKRIEYEYISLDNQLLILYQIGWQFPVYCLLTTVTTSLVLKKR